MNKFLSKQRLIILGLAIMGVTSSYGQAVGDEFTVENDAANLVYHITLYSGTANGDNQVSVLGTADSPEETTIPQEVIDDKNNKYKVVSIFRFANATKVKKLNVPEGVTTISEGAFNRLGSLQEINLPASLSAIEKSAFAYCI